MRINTNISSLAAQDAASNTNKTLNSSLEKLSTGLKINKAADDASGLSIADKLRTQASSLTQGISNGNSASALIQIADKAMAEQSNILDTVKTKLIQASTSTTSAEGRESIRKDISKLLEQFDNIAAQTNYNGTTLLQKSSTDTAKQDTLSFQLGEDSSFDSDLVQTRASNTAALGGGGDAFGASSISSSVDAAAILAANTVGGVGFGDDLTATHNNITTSGSQQLSTTGGVSISSVIINATTGVETAAVTHGIDVTLSGEIGTVETGGAAVMDFSSESSELQDFAKLTAAGDGNLTYDETKDQLTFTAAGSVDFGDLEVSSLRVNDDGSTTGVSALNSLEINKGGRDDANSIAVTSTFTISNNVHDRVVDNGLIDYEYDGQLNVMSTNAADITGGLLLGDLKNLDTDGLSSDVANKFMSTIDASISQLNANRSDFGSTQNQIESSVRNMQTTAVNLKAAESVIRDVDYASESANFNKQNIISQAGTYAMSQANSMQQNVMRLLQ